MTNLNGYRARLRFRLLKKLDIKDREHVFKVRDRDVVLSPELPDTDISDSDWLVMNTRGFSSEEEARSFADNLKLAVEFSSIATRLGVDTGVDLATSGLGAAVREHILRVEKLDVRDNVHGIDVFADEPNIRIFNLKGSGTIRAKAEPFLTDLTELHSIVGNASQRARDVALLLNFALLRTDPVSQIIFAFSAVEMLGQDEDWTNDQKRLLQELAIAATNSTIGSVEERDEVAVAIKKNLHRLSLRQGVFRLIKSLGLDDLKGEWDRLYGQRSTLVHGLAPKPGIDYSPLATEAVSLCGQIMLRAISKEIALVDRYTDRYYKSAVTVGRYIGIHGA